MQPPSRGLSSVLVIGALSFVLLTALLSTNFDFRAFYCAGYAVRTHASPYRTQPLHTCERTMTDATFAAFFKDVALPAPQPGYDVAAFSLLSRLPFAAASKLWTVVLLACALATVLLLQRLVRVPLAGVLAALWLSLCVTSLYLGELIPLCLCAIAAAALFAQRRLHVFAGIAAAATLVEPHIGIPICLSAALWLPRSRAAIAICVLALGAVSLAVLGVRQNIEYVTAVLPAHALSEIRSDAQLSLSAVLHAFGVSDGVALRIGTLSFVVITIAGLPMARRLARRFDDPAFIIAVPAALSVVGSVFIHVTEIAAAVPLALLLIAHARAGRTLPVAALLLLAIPWWSLATPMLFGTTTGVVLAAVTLFVLLRFFTTAQPLPSAVCAVVAGALVVAVLRWHDATAIHAMFSAPASLGAASYPETSWKWFNDAYMATGSAPSWLLRAATWSGLALTVWRVTQIA